MEYYNIILSLSNSDDKQKNVLYFKHLKWTVRPSRAGEFGHSKYMSATKSAARVLLPDIFRTIFNWLNIDFPFGKLRSWKMDCVCKLWYREVGGNGLDGRPPALQIGKSWKVFSMLSNFLRQFFSLHLISWNEVRWGVEDLFQSNFFFGLVAHSEQNWIKKRKVLETFTLIIVKGLLLTF